MGLQDRGTSQPQSDYMYLASYNTHGTTSILLLCLYLYMLCVVRTSIELPQGRGRSTTLVTVPGVIILIIDDTQPSV